jgi:branched-chain amino acid transport system substrate-binding protein
MGFLLARFLVEALQKTKPPYTMATVNKAIVGINKYSTEMLCQPWVYGKLSLHIPNNTDYTTTPENGKMITAQGCTAISSADPQIAQYHKVAATAGVDYK